MASKVIALPKMVPAVKKVWLSALRGGEFKPGTGKVSRVLPDGSRVFDAMGVLASLHALAHPEFAATQTNPEEYPLHIVAEWAGIHGRYVDGVYVVPYYAVVMYHDQWGEATFERIANWIEENL